MLIRLHAPLFVLVVVGLCGCARTASVTGQVTAEGKAVTGGGIVLSPLNAKGAAAAGRPGMADIRSDGSFSLDVELADAGVNRFAVRFSPPQEIPTRAFKDGVIPYSGFVPKQTEVEIKPGPNVVNIELKPGGPRAGPNK